MRSSDILSMVVKLLGFPWTIPRKFFVSWQHSTVSANPPSNFILSFSRCFLILGLVCCEVDHEVFIGTWSLPPDPSVLALPDGRPLVLYVPLHVDDGLGITNSPSLYRWFLSTLAKRLHIVDLGPCSKFLSIVILRDRSNRQLWLSSHVYVAELLEEWNLTSCRAVSTPFPANFSSSLSIAPTNALPDVSDVDLLPKYQRLVGCLLYLAIATRPDLPYYAMWLGQIQCEAYTSSFSCRQTRTSLLGWNTDFRPMPWDSFLSGSFFSTRLYAERRLLGCWLGIWLSRSEKYIRIFVLFFGFSCLVVSCEAEIYCPLLNWGWILRNDSCF